jgi:hypothetical protein
MQKLNAVAAFAIAFVLTVFAVTFWTSEGVLFLHPDSGVETTRASAPVTKTPNPRR